jgi:L-arabinonolactonase
MNGPKVELALSVDNHLGETPVWSAAEQSLYWVNCEHPPQVHRWNPASGRHDVWEQPKRVGAVALKADGGVLLAMADGLYDLDTASGEATLRAASPAFPKVSLHEGQVDRQGRFWIGGFDHGFNPIDRKSHETWLSRLDGDVLTPVAGGIAISNGLAFSPDGATLYHADSPSRVVDAFDLDPPTGALSNKRAFVTLPPGEGFVDGAVVDAEGGYWLAVVALAQLRRFTPDGALDRIIELPFTNPTKAAFGGPDLDTLYITSCQLNLPTQVTPTTRNGDIWAVKPGVKGLPEPLFQD